MNISCIINIKFHQSQIWLPIDQQSWSWSGKTTIYRLRRYCHTFAFSARCSVHNWRRHKGNHIVRIGKGNCRQCDRYDEWSKHQRTIDWYAKMSILLGANEFGHWSIVRVLQSFHVYRRMFPICSIEILQLYTPFDAKKWKRHALIYCSLHYF